MKRQPSLNELFNRFDAAARQWGWASDELNDPHKSKADRAYRRAKRALQKAISDTENRILLATYTIQRLEKQGVAQTFGER